MFSIWLIVVVVVDDLRMWQSFKLPTVREAWPLTVVLSFWSRRAMAPPTKPAADSGKPIGRQLYEATRDGNEEEVDALLRKGAPVSFMSVQFHPLWCFVERVVGSTRSSASGVIFVNDGHARG